MWLKFSILLLTLNPIFREISIPFPLRLRLILNILLQIKYGINAVYVQKTKETRNDRLQ